MLEVLDSSILALGPMARRFEEAFAAFCGTRHAVAVSSGTAGLHLAVRLAGVGPGDEVITSPICFVASANAALYEGAVPVFADVDPSAPSTSIRPPSRRRSPRARAPSCRCTSSAYPASIAAAQRDRRAPRPRHHRGRLRGARRPPPRPAWSARTAIPAVFAFYPNKQMTTGEGGMVTTDDDAFAAQRARARQPGALGLRRLARARPPGLQLPHGRALGRGRARPDRAAATRSSRPAPRSLRATARCSAGSPA